tara:strand:+ start:35232 stop:37550 length:2319 start_codon:yes stop_codon:yes gene_type:complete
MRKVFAIILVLLLSIPINSSADEGMWLPMFIKRLNIQDMQSKGLNLTAEEIYSVNTASLKDAIISFNGYCTGEIISPKGLLLTNHHCGYDAIQNHSLGEKDYLGDGFWAKSLEEELPNEGMFVDFLVRMEDVTKEVLDSIDYDTEEDSRNDLISKRIKDIKNREIGDSNYWAEIKPFFGGNEYYLFIYERYNDVRLVGAPPESIGKYGGDTDNWMWPRHTGDFAFFRIYTAPDGSPAEYSEENIPLVPKHHLPISLDGVDNNDFAMVMGYPGGTDRYLSSFGVQSAIETYNPTVVKVRAAKLDILNNYMRNDREVSIMYASKKARISNYWKYYIGQTRGLKRLNVYEKKKDLEKSFESFANSSESNKKIYGNVLANIEAANIQLGKTTLSRIYLNEAAWSGPSFVRLARRSESLLRALDGGDKSKIVTALNKFKEQVNSNFEEYKKEIDKDIFIKMMDMYFSGVPKNQLPNAIDSLQKRFRGDFEKWGNALYDKSIFVDKEKMNDFLNSINTNFGDVAASIIRQDPAYKLQKSILSNYFQVIRPQDTAPQKSLNVANRLYIDGLRKMYPNKKFYPNANFTMRLTYGSIGDYNPGDAVHYDFITTLSGVMEKMDNDNPEFIVPEKLTNLYDKKDYGKYGNNDGTINVCFISNNDITGGNSGSPVINGDGHLIGCAFDGNWEAMSGDIAFEDQLQRTISVDVRYILFITDKFAGANNIIDELTLISTGKKTKKSRKLPTYSEAWSSNSMGIKKRYVNKAAFVADAKLWWAKQAN